MANEASEYRVVIVLDPSCGERIVDIGRAHDIWIVPSPANRDAADRLWRLVELDPDPPLVSMWSAPRTGDTESEWLGILQDIEMHHGEYAHDPVVSTLHVIGAAPATHVRAVLTEFGFSGVEVQADGFIARRAVRPTRRCSRRQPLPRESQVRYSARAVAAAERQIRYATRLRYARPRWPA